MHLSLSPKYCLKGTIQGLEAYMMATSDGQKVKHAQLGGYGYLYDGEHNLIHKIDMTNDEARSRAVHDFNQLMKAHFKLSSAQPLGKYLGCGVVYFDMDSSCSIREDMTAAFKFMPRVVNVLVKWGHREHISWLLCPHYAQFVPDTDNEVQPVHAHILWTKQPRQIDEFQRVIKDHKDELGCEAVQL